LTPQGKERTIKKEEISNKEKNNTFRLHVLTIFIFHYKPL